MQEGNVADKYRQEVRNALKGMTPKELRYLSKIITELMEDEPDEQTEKRK